MFDDLVQFYFLLTNRLMIVNMGLDYVCVYVCGMRRGLY